MVVIPAAEGEIGVLPGHAPMIVLLRGGMIAAVRGRADHRAGCSSPAASPRSRPTACHRAGRRGDGAAPTSRAPKASGGWRRREAEYDRIDKADVPALDAAMARMQSARAMIEVAGGAA